MDLAQVRAIAEKECDYPADPSCVRISVGSSPENTSGNRLFNLLQSKIKGKEIPAQVVKTGSFGCSDYEPIVTVNTPGYSILLCLNADPEMAAGMDTDAFAAGMANQGGDWYFVSGKNTEDMPHISSLPLFDLQNRIVLRNCGRIDPGNAGHYIRRGNGFVGLSRVLQKKRQELMELFSSLPLQGYVHAGLSSLDQWKECLKSEPSDRYLICDAVSADPGGHGTQLLLESDPHSILEGMLISAYAVGASRCILYIRAGIRAAANLRALLQTIQKYNLVGSGILGSSFDAQIEIMEVPETIRAGQVIESLRCIGPNRSSSHILPTFPAPEKRMPGPVIITNAELMAYLPSVFLVEGEMQPGFGFNSTAVTKIISLSGSIVRAATAEVPCGVSLRDVIESIGGGVAAGKTLKALQVGFPTGGLLGPAALYDCAHCRTSGESCSGSASIDVLGSDADIVEIARIRMETVNNQSCGKCLFCFEGSLQMSNVLDKIIGGQGKLRDLEFLAELGGEMKNGCLCAFGRLAPDFVLSSMELFPEEYERRIQASSYNVQTS